MSVRLTLLGGASLLRGHQPLSGPASQRQSLALLAVLAAHDPLGISREKLGALLWPESTEENARNSLKQALHILRRELGSEAVNGTTTLHLGADALSCDLTEFQGLCARNELDEAIETYGGPFLDGFHLGGDSEEFERWCDGERARRARELGDALDALATRAAERANHSSALDRWQRLAEHDPLNGRAARGIVVARAALGDTAGALRHAERYSQSIAQELGLPPDPEIRALVAKLRSATPHEFPSVAVERAEERTADRDASVEIALRRPPRRAAFAAAGAIAALGLVIALVRCGEALSPPSFDRRRVVVTAFSRETDDTAMASARRFVAEAIARRLASAAIATPTVLLAGPATEPRSAGLRSGAGFVVSVSSIAVPSGVAVETELTDVATGEHLWSSPRVILPVGGETTAADTLAERSATAVAVRLDPKLVRWIGHASQPSSLDSYREFRLAMDRYFRFEPEAATPHFLAVAARDTAFTMARVMASWSLYQAGNGGGHELISADSIARSLQGRQLAPLDRALVEHQMAVFNRDLSAAYLAAGAVVAAAPGSEWRYLLAESAFAAGRAHEAVRVSEEIDPDMGFLAGFESYWTTLELALHLAGEHEHELEVMREARRRFPTNRIITRGYVKALAATGHVAEVEVEVERTMTLRHKNMVWANQPMETAIRELDAHGYPAAARRLAALTADWIQRLPAAERADFAPALPWYIEEAGRLGEARALIARLLVTSPAEVDPLDMAVIAAQAGDSATARAVDARFARVTDPHVLYDYLCARARIAGALGDRETAVRLLRDSYRAGFDRRDVPHLYHEFFWLKGYPPYDALTRPVD